MSAFAFRSVRESGKYGVPISVFPAENIDKLARANVSEEPSAVVLSLDSVLGVSMNLYELRNLGAYMSTQEPDTADKSVLFYSRREARFCSGRKRSAFLCRGFI